MTDLIILRGNSGSGKSTVAAALRAQRPGLVVVEQDHLRRQMLGEFDERHAGTIGLIDVTVRYAISRGYPVLLEGILDRARYGPMLLALCRDHIGPVSVLYFDIPFEETARRHATRAKAADFSVREMRAWHRDKDLLGWETEQVIGAELTVAEVVKLCWPA